MFDFAKPSQAKAQAGPLLAFISNFPAIQWNSSLAYHGFSEVCKQTSNCTNFIDFINEKYMTITTTVGNAHCTLNTSRDCFRLHSLSKPKKRIIINQKWKEISLDALKTYDPALLDV